MTEHEGTHETSAKKIYLYINTLQARNAFSWKVANIFLLLVGIFGENIVTLHSETRPTQAASPPALHILRCYQHRTSLRREGAGMQTADPFYHRCKSVVKPF